MNHKLLLPLIVAAGLSACSKAPAPPSEPAQPIVSGQQLRFPANHPQLKLLRVTTAAPSKAVEMDLPARLAWNEDHTQRLYAAFNGRVQAIRADLGAKVQPGSVLAELASPDFGQAQTDAARARIDLAQSERGLARQRELADAGIVARKDLEQAQADADRARAEAVRAEARTRLYGGGSVSQALALRATIGGIVVERNLNPGQELRADQSGNGVPAVFVVTDPRSLWVTIDARESEVGTLQPGATFELIVPALPGRQFTGHIAAVADFIDPATRTIKVRGIVENPDRLLKAEMLASARFERQLGAGVVVPASAVLMTGDRQRVFVETAPGTFEPRDVELGYQGPRDVLVRRGLEAGDRVVSDNLLLLDRQFHIAQEDAGGGEPPASAPASGAKAAAASTGARP